LHSTVQSQNSIQGSINISNFFHDFCNAYKIRRKEIFKKNHGKTNKQKNTTKRRKKGWGDTVMGWFQPEVLLRRFSLVDWKKNMSLVLFL